MTTTMMMQEVMFMKMRIQIPAEWKVPTFLKLFRTQEIKASVQTQSVVCQDQTLTIQDPAAKMIRVIQVNMWMIMMIVQGHSELA